MTGIAYCFISVLSNLALQLKPDVKSTRIPVSRAIPEIENKIVDF